jgi:hypothetical protein
MLTLTAANIFEQGSMNKLLAGDATYYGRFDNGVHDGLQQLQQQIRQMRPDRLRSGSLGSLKSAVGSTQTSSRVYLGPVIMHMPALQKLDQSSQQHTHLSNRILTSPTSISYSLNLLHHRRFPPAAAAYAGYRTRGFGHCSFHFHGFGNSKGYAGTPLAINAAQYTGPSVCGLCVKYRGIGQGLGGNPVSTAWQQGFICDQCPECKFGDLDQQMGGDGRWRVEWYPVQCPVGGSNFRFGFQGGNPWYRKMMVANARVPLKSVRIWESGAWKSLTGTIDNYW